MKPGDFFNFLRLSFVLLREKNATSDDEKKPESSRRQRMANNLFSRAISVN